MLAVLRRHARALTGCAALALGACAVPMQPMQGQREAPRFSPATEHFSIAGRMSARHSGEGLSAHFRWEHDEGRDELQLASPLGETIARMSGTNGSVELERADGSRESARGWDALTVRGLGWTLPVDGLGWWIQGVAHPRSASTWEASSDPPVLRQDGWTIVYGGVVSENGAARPSRLTLSYPEVEVRIAIDRWQ